MNKHFRSLTSRILLDFAIAALISSLIYMVVSEILIDVFAQYAESPKVFKRISDEQFEDLQRFADENEIVSTNGKAFTEWNDEHFYVSLLIVRQNEAMCYNSFVSYDMTYTESDEESFYWGSKVLPVYTYYLRLADETCKVYFSGYFDMVYQPLRTVICVLIFMCSFALIFFLLFRKYTFYISDIEENVKSICNRDFSSSISVKDSSELSSLASNINKMSETIQLYFSAEEAKQKEKEQFVKSIAHDIRTPLTAVIGYLELMNISDADTEQCNYFLARALDKANHIRALTDDLFNFEENYEKLQFEEYDGRELLAQMQMSVTNYLKSNNIRFIYDNDIKTNFSVNANITLLLRLADNICSNILKHASQREPVRFHSSISENVLIIKQQNTVKNETDSTHVSDGYGLKICGKILDSMKGSLSYSTSGNVFTLELTLPVVIDKTPGIQ